ncbi:MAG: hypothetical protein KDK74_08570 [Cephaloticoccus sp.]|nr:hypothetical protein [Cephaloticoccus sp.]
MNRLLILFLLATMSAQAAGTYSEKIRFVLEQLRQEKNAAGEPLIAGRSESYGGRNGAFYLLAPFVLEWATKEDVAMMLADASPIVREREKGVRPKLVNFCTP